MTQLMVCSCLNVEIYCKEILDKIPLKDKTNDPFFDSASYASLTIAGVTKVIMMMHQCNLILFNINLGL